MKEIIMYKLKVKYGTYKTDSFIELCWVMFKHRLHHFCKGEGFKD